MEDTLRKEVEAVVAQIFSAQEETDKRKQIEDTLTQSAETIEALTASLESKTEELKVAEATIVEKTSTFDNLNTELEAAKQEIIILKEDLVKASEDLNKSLEELNGIKKDISTKARMAELSSLSIVIDVKAQTEKVSEMTDEVFASYRDELVSLRKSIAEELSKSTANDLNDTTKSTDVPPANITNDDVVNAALNLELASTDDLKSKYKKLGLAMAEQMK